LVVLLVLSSGVTAACGSEDIPPGHKGFLFEKTGVLLLYMGGDGLQTDELLGPGTHYTGLYGELKMVNCQDREAKEVIEVLSKADLPVTIHVRVTYAIDCTSPERVATIIDTVKADKDGVVQGEFVYQRYVMPVIRGSLRDSVSGISIEAIKGSRETLKKALNRALISTSVPADDEGPAVNDKLFLIKVLEVSQIILPEEITQKNKEIELARQEAEQEVEKRNAAKVRLERELFEAQEQRKVAVEQEQAAAQVDEVRANKAKAVAIIAAQAKLEEAKLKADSIRAVNAALTPEYMSYLTLMENVAVQKAMAAALGNGTVFYVDKDFLVPPNTNTSVAVPPRGVTVVTE